MMDTTAMVADSMLTPEDFRLALDRLGYTDLQREAFAYDVGVTSRTVRRWAQGEQAIPKWVGVVLGFMEMTNRRSPSL